MAAWVSFRKEDRASRVASLFGLEILAMRPRARQRRRAERPHTTTAARAATATSASAGRSTITGKRNRTKRSAGAATDPQLQGRVPELERLPDLPLQVAHVGR